MTHTFKKFVPGLVLPDADSGARNRVSTANRPRLKPPDDHPDAGLLERFMRGELSGASGRAECRKIVRHLLAGCPQCVQVTGRLWALGELPEPGGLESDGLDGSDRWDGSDPPGFI